MFFQYTENLHTPRKTICPTTKKYGRF